MVVKQVNKKKKEAKSIDCFSPVPMCAIAGFLTGSKFP